MQKSQLLNLQETKKKYQIAWLFIFLENFTQTNCWIFADEEVEDEHDYTLLLYALSGVVLWSSLWTTGYLPTNYVACLNPRMLLILMKRAFSCPVEESDALETVLRTFECQCADCNLLMLEAARKMKTEPSLPPKPPDKKKPKPKRKKKRVETDSDEDGKELS